jgi:type I restriction enzyme S subunit
MPYDEYRLARLPWLGQVPAHWIEKRAKYFFREVDERSQTGEEELLSVSHMTGVTPRSQKNVTMFKAESYVGHKLCHPDDLVINTMWAWMGALGVAKQTGLISPSYAVYRPIDSDAFIPEYLDYLLRTKQYVAEYCCRSTGIRSSRLRLYPEKFLDLPILCPPRNEQQRIVAFLREKDRQFRCFIRNKRRLIELLNEQKQAIVNQAVTRGIDPSVRLKSSGVDWLGDAPEHWEIRRLKQVCQFAYGDSLPDETRVKGDVPVYGSNGQVGNHHAANTQGPCIVIGRKGSFGKVNYSAVPVFAIDTTFFVDERFTSADLRWLFYALMWARLDSVTKDAAVPGLDRSEAYSKILPWCSQSEQRHIAIFLDRELSNIDVSISQANREIELIREYRTRLIADVLTGKVDVRRLVLEIIEPGPEDFEPLEDDDNFSEEDAEAPEDFELAEESLK